MTVISVSAFSCKCCYDVCNSVYIHANNPNYCSLVEWIECLNAAHHACQFDIKMIMLGHVDIKMMMLGQLRLI